MKIEIMPAKVKDAQAILDYCKAVGGESDNLTFGYEGLLLSLEQEEGYLKSIQDAENQVFLLAKYKDEIVGTASFSGFNKQRLAHRGEVAVSVRKAMWGLHIGSQLMESCIEFAKGCGVKIISLEVRSDNQRAIALYRKFGFEKIGCFKGFLQIDGSWVDCDLMNLYL